MRYVAPVIFGKHPEDVVPQQWNYLGMQGWYRVPLGWFTRREDDGNITASPNSDFTPPLYSVLINIDGYMVFQDLGRNNQDGLLSPAQH